MFESIRFRPLARTDFALLSSWLQEPHVARWWPDDSTFEGLEADYGGVIDGTEPAAVFIALEGERPLGLTQRFRLAAYPEYMEEVEALAEVPESAASIDYLIGRPADSGRGLGTRMLQAFVDQLHKDDSGCSSILVPVHSSNRGSWRVLEHVGFYRVASGEMAPDNPADSRDHFVYRLDF